MRRTIPLAAVVAVTLALTACGGDPEPAASSAAPAAAASEPASPSRLAVGERVRRRRSLRGAG